METLRFNDKKPEVRELQSLLNKIMEITPPLAVHGHFDRNTEAAVRKFQAVYNIGIDGIVGPVTWKTLKEAEEKKAPGDHEDIKADAPWMEYAKRELGKREIAGDEHNPRIVAYHATTTLAATTDEVPWCSSFVNWVLKEAGIEGTNSAAAASWLRWGKAATAETGAITVIKNAKTAESSLTSSGNHVGFLVEETATHYRILGGNQSNRVKISSYPKASWILRGYRWPG